MIENQPPAIEAPNDVRPTIRDFGFVLIGIALGIGLGSSLTYPAILILAIGLAVTGSHFTRKSR